MKTAFIFDTVLLKRGEDYYGMTLTYDFFEKRYLDKTNRMVVITREDDMSKHEKESVGYRKTNGKNIEVSPIGSYKVIPDIFKKRKRIYKELEEKIAGVDKVIIRMPSVLGIVAAKICKKQKKPYFIECVACALDGYLNHTSPFGKIIALPMFLACRKAIKKADYTLYVTNKFLQGRYPTDGKKCACTDVVLNDGGRHCKNNYSISKNTLNVYTVGNVGMKYKGHLYVFKAIKKLKAKGKTVKYYMIGNGNYMRLLLNAKKLGVVNDVHFLGSMTHEDVMAELEKADLYIQPSLVEGLSRALIEAMDVGCPAIASDAGGNPELLPAKYIFKKKNVHQLTKMIESYFALDLRKEAGEQNKKYISSKFDSELLTKKRNNFYTEYLSSR